MNRMRLGVNVDHVATIREARKTTEPDPVTAAMLAEQGGADQITLHLREDRRHIQNRDARLMSEMAQTMVNLEMAATSDMQEIALALHPDSVTLVPERREEVTTEGGLDLLRLGDSVSGVVNALKQGGVKIAAFITPDFAQIKEAARLGFDAVEIHTGSYAFALIVVSLTVNQYINVLAWVDHGQVLHGVDHHLSRLVVHVGELKRIAADYRPTRIHAVKLSRPDGTDRHVPALRQYALKF